MTVERAEAPLTPPARTPSPANGIPAQVAQLLAGEVVNKGLRFAATIVLARALTPADFGLLNVAIAISGIVLIVSSLGLPDLGARDVAVAPSEAGWLYGRILAARLSALAGLSGVCFLLAAVVWPDRAALLALAALMAAFMTSSGDWLARGLSRMAVFAAASATGGGVLIIICLLVVRREATPEVALAAFAAAEAGTALVIWLTVMRGAGVRVGFSGTGPLVRRARPLAFSAIIIYSYYANLDTLILAATRSAAEAGLYSAPYRMFLVLNLTGTFSAFAILPVLSRYAAAGEARASVLLKKALAWLAVYGFIVLAIAEVLARPGLGAVFGNNFEVAAPTLILLVASVGWYSVGFPAGYSLIALDRYRSFLLGAGVAGATNLGLNLILIPFLGMEGAGIATLVAFAAAALVWLRERGLLSEVRWTVVALCVVTAGASTAAAWPATRQLCALATLVVAVGFAVKASQMGRLQARVGSGS